MSKQNWRRTRNYRKWRIAVIRRDKKCVMCGSRKRRQAHHIKNGTHHPESRFDVENGITLCYNCHKALHTSYKRSYRMKTTEYDMNQFKELRDHFFRQFVLLRYIPPDFKNG